MAKKVDWYYHRKGCTTCKKMDGLLEACDVTAKETVSATKDRIDAAGAQEPLARVSKVIVAKGKKVLKFDLRKTERDDPELLAAVIGPTGNLRAPTIIRGKTMIVGFNEEEFGPLFA